MEQYRNELDRLSVDAAEKAALAQRLMEGKKASRRGQRNRFALRPILIAACLAGALAVGAMAAELSGAWQRFFLGRVGDDVIQVDVSAVTGDYTLTMEEAIVDEDGATFLLALTCTDGGVLEGKPRLSGNLFRWDVKVDGEYPASMSMGSQEPIASEDGRTVYYCVEFQNVTGKPADLVGREVTFVCDGVADMAWSEGEIAQIKSETVSLTAGLAVQTAVSWEDAKGRFREADILELLEQVADDKLPLALGDGQTVRVSGVIFGPDGPLVAVEWPGGQYRQGNYLATGATPQRLTDTRTGESWGITEYHYLYQGSCGVASFSEDCPLTAEDLPYVELKVGYQMEKVLSNEPVELTFLAERGGGITKDVDQSVVFDGMDHYEGTLSSVRLSTLRLRLNMEDTAISAVGDNADYNAGRLVMKDGTEWVLHARGNHLDSDTGQGWLGLEPQDAQGNRVLIDPTQVKTMYLGESRVQLG